MNKPWDVADQEEGPKLCSSMEVTCSATTSEVYDVESYLPCVPACSYYTVESFDEELRKTYSLLQDYEVSLHHLFSDQRKYEIPFKDEINNIIKDLDILLTEIRNDILEQKFEPDNEHTSQISELIWCEQSDRDSRQKRDFVFLRDTRAALVHTSETFQRFES